MIRDIIWPTPATPRQNTKYADFASFRHFHDDYHATLSSHAAFAYDESTYYVARRKLRGFMMYL